MAFPDSKRVSKQRALAKILENWVISQPSFCTSIIVPKNKKDPGINKKESNPEKLWFWNSDLSNPCMQGKGKRKGILEHRFLLGYFFHILIKKPSDKIYKYQNQS